MVMKTKRVEYADDGPWQTEVLPLLKRDHRQQRPAKSSSDWSQRNHVRMNSSSTNP